MGYFNQVLRPSFIRLSTILVPILLTASTTQASIDDPSQGPLEQARGSYASGTLVNALNFGLSGDGFLKLFQPRDRGYGTFDLIYVIKTAAAKIRRDFPESERLQIGDTSQKQGGAISGHGSHQNGLDADVVFFRENRREQNPMQTNGFDEDFLNPTSLAPTPNFAFARNWRFVKALFSTGRINRIFIDQNLKNAICKYTQEIGEFTASTEILRKLRHWPAHSNHMHVRITCPKNSPTCVAQEAPPAGNGCFESAEANDDALRAQGVEP